MCMSNHIPLQQRQYTPSLCDTHQNATPTKNHGVQVLTCQGCDQHFALCCKHRGGLRSGFPCHQTRIMYVDGATSNNGYGGARSGIGCSCGTKSEHEESIHVDDQIDGNNPRTNQRAELLAVLYGLSHLERTEDDAWHPGLPAHVSPHLQDWLVLTDSEYVFLGVTTRFEEHASRGGQKGDGSAVANWDLITEIVRWIEKEENKGRKVGFAWIPREKNARADQLAKQARDRD